MSFKKFFLLSSSLEQIVIAGKGKSPVKSIRVDVAWGSFWYLIKQLQVCQIVMKTQENKINRTKKRKMVEIGLALHLLASLVPIFQLKPYHNLSSFDGVKIDILLFMLAIWGFSHFIGFTFIIENYWQWKGSLIFSDKQLLSRNMIYFCHYTSLYINVHCKLHMVAFLQKLI